MWTFGRPKITKQELLEQAVTVAELQRVTSLLNSQNGLVQRLAGELDEAFASAAEARAEASRLRETVVSQEKEFAAWNAAICSDLEQVGGMIAERTSAIGVIKISQAIMGGRSRVAALVAGSLVTGYAKAKDEPTVTVGGITVPQSTFEAIVDSRKPTDAVVAQRDVDLEDDEQPTHEPDEGGDES